MFGFVSRHLFAGCKQRLATCSASLAASSSASRVQLLSPSSSVTASSPSPLHTAATSFFTSHKSFGQPSLLSLSASLSGKSCAGPLISGGSWTIPVRHQTSDFTVRDSFQVLYNKKDWDVLERIHKATPKPHRKPKLSPIGLAPHLKGVVLKTLIKKPKKPNSANRKCVLVRLSNGKECVALVPGEGHNLQEHSTVLVVARRTSDLIGVHVRIVRGKYDCAPVKKKVT